jgi:hypothetical protein
MYFYILTSLGRQAIPPLKSEGRDDEAGILEFLRGGAATVEDIKNRTALDESTISIYLSAFVRKKWVNRRRT